MIWITSHILLRDEGAAAWINSAENKVTCREVAPEEYKASDEQNREKDGQDTMPPGEAFATMHNTGACAKLAGRAGEDGSDIGARSDGCRG